MTKEKTKNRDILEKIITYANEKKPDLIKIMNVGKITSLTDYFVIIKGSSNIHLRSIADNIKKKMKENGQNVWHMEGYENAKWILMDYVDIVIHIFDEETYYYYDIESLWGNAEVETLKTGE